MFSTALMPLANSVTRVALPIIRDVFQLQADMTAWVAVAFTLPFVTLMLLYGRLGDGLDKRRLILFGSLLSSVGALLTSLSPTLGWLLIGRAIQGVGLAGMMPLALSLISATFPDSGRAKALGTWSSIGPTTAFVGPLMGGLFVGFWGWRAAFVAPLVVGMVAFFVVRGGIPPRETQAESGFLRSFDWIGVILLALSTTFLIFYLSSRPITGVAPLQDWRLLSVTIVLLVTFWMWERRREKPFVSFSVFGNRLFNRATFCAAMRMMVMGALNLLVPLYLVDIHHVSLAQLGGVLMINPGAMALAVRFSGRLSSSWGHRSVVMLGLCAQGLVMLIFSLLPASSAGWAVYLTLAIYGVGAGLMLAPLHHAALLDVPSEQAGMAAGLYSMLRFVGSVVGTALAGVFLQYLLDQSVPTIGAYQRVFLAFVLFPAIGMIVGLGLKKRRINA